MLSLIFQFLFLLLTFSLACTSHIDVRQNCPANYEPCSPPGALNVAVPSFGSGALGNLFLDLVDTVNPQPITTLEPSATSGPAKMARDTASTICCALGTTCMLLRGLQLPLCYDRFTTDYFLFGGSFGTVSNGSYYTAVGDKANLISGNFQLSNGQVGNLYNAVPNEKPDTSTLAIPTQWTSSGVGTAIPGSQLGNLATYTTVIPGSYIPLTTVLPSTIPAVTAGYGSIYTLANATVVPGYTFGGSSAPPVTVIMTTARASITPPITRAGAQGTPEFSMAGMIAALAVVMLVMLS